MCIWSHFSMLFVWIVHSSSCNCIEWLLLHTVTVPSHWTRFSSACSNVTLVVKQCFWIERQNKLMREASKTNTSLVLCHCFLHTDQITARSLLAQELKRWTLEEPADTMEVPTVLLNDLQDRAKTIAGWECLLELGRKQGRCAVVSHSVLKKTKWASTDR